MPSDILSADTGFPTFTGDMSTDQKIERVTNYLFMLLEQLRYTLSNLGVDNFNDTELAEIGKVITKPIYVRLEDELSGKLTSLQATVDGLSGLVSSYEGQVAEFSVTVDGFNTTVSNYEKQVSSYTQTVDGFNTKVSNYEKQVSSYTQTVDGFNTKVSNYEGQVSSYSQTVAGFNTTVSNYEGQVAEFSEKANKISLVVTDAGKVNAASIAAAINSAESSVTISADKIKMTGTTTFLSSSKNSEGELEINGNSLGITLDGYYDYGSTTIESDNGINFYYKKTDYYTGAEHLPMGRIYAKVDGENTNTTSRYSLNIESEGFVNSEGGAALTALKLSSAGKVSIEGGGIYIGSTASSFDPERNCFITLDATAGTRIRAIMSYQTMKNNYENKGYESFNPGVGYVFCSDGLYYYGNKILSTPST